MSDQRVVEACKAVWAANQHDCSGFVRAVGDRLGVAIAGNADQIVGTLRGGGTWTMLPDGAAAAASAMAGKLVIGGLRGDEQAVRDAHGHVVVVVGGALNRGKYPRAYWGSLGGVGAEDQTINWAWTAADRDRVTYAAHDLA
ncbi:MAG: hypothetical protein JSR21_11165 [Proteobacteria bacterium]|nr:hypothetical protein [Pseudomonadota bacterium]